MTIKPPSPTCPLSTALNWYHQGQKVAVATVVETWGSAPRPLGSQLFIKDDGIFEGSVSGGCIEGAVIEEAISLIETNETKILEFGVSNETAWEVGLSCGGTIKVLVSVLNAQSYDQYLAFLEAKNKRKTGVLKHPLASPEVTFDLEQSPVQSNPSLSDDHFILPLMPSLQLYVIGAVHIAKHLAALAHDLGYKTTIIDPREAFTNSFNLGMESITVLNSWPDEALAANPSPNCPVFDDRTALITLTHDPKLDDPALEIALEQGCGYIGCLGSKKTHGERLKRMAAKGLEEEAKSIHGPIGLNIGAKGAGEIAVSIMAELIQHFRLKQKG